MCGLVSEVQCYTAVALGKPRRSFMALIVSLHCRCAITTFYSQQCCNEIKSRVNGIYYVGVSDGATHRLPYRSTNVRTCTCGRITQHYLKQTLKCQEICPTCYYLLCRLFFLVHHVLQFHFHQSLLPYTATPSNFPGFSGKTGSNEYQL